MGLNVEPEADAIAVFYFIHSFLFKLTCSFPVHKLHKMTAVPFIIVGHIVGIVPLWPK